MGVQWATGGPLRVAGVEARVVGIDLAIAFDASSVRVRSTYALSVPSGGTAEWAVALPKAYRCDPENECGVCDDELPHAATETEAAARKHLRLTVAGRAVGSCRLAAAPEVQWWDGRPELAPWRPGVMKGTDVWCVFEVPMPAGTSVPLVLEYTGSLDYADYTFHAERRFRWDVLPGGAPRTVWARAGARRGPHGGARQGERRGRRERS